MIKAGRFGLPCSGTLSGLKSTLKYYWRGKPDRDTPDNRAAPLPLDNRQHQQLLALVPPSEFSLLGHFPGQVYRWPN